MERKLVKQGQNALTVTLPAKWLQKKGLFAGDTVFISQKGAKLEISAKGSTEKIVEVIDFTNCTKSEMWHLFHASYMRGADEITVIHSTPKHIEEIVSAHIGFVITSHTRTKTIIKSIVTIPEDAIDAVIKRVLYMFKEHTNFQNKNYTEIKAYEKLLDANIRYCIRYVAKYYEKSDSYKYFYMMMVIEEAADKISELAKQKISKNTQELVKQMCSIYVDSVIRTDFSKAYAKLIPIRKTLPKKTYADGLVSELFESLYNNLGYLLT